MKVLYIVLTKHTSDSNWKIDKIFFKKKVAKDYIKSMGSIENMIFNRDYEYTIERATVE